MFNIQSPPSNVTSTNFSSSSSGSNYILTNSSAAITFGTTSPIITLTAPGAYLLFGHSSLIFNGATFAASQNVTLKFRRTNNVEVDIGSSIILSTNIIITLTQTMGSYNLPVSIYTTSNTDDIITLFADVGVLPSVGSLECNSAKIVAVKIG